jgi:hypothetical protein
MQIIAISGKIGRGKDTAVECITQYVREEKNKTVKHLKFADALKKATAIMTGTSEADQYTSEGKGKIIPSLGITIGDFQQKIGMVAREHIDPNIWVNAVMNQMTDENCVYVISDCRFKNEARQIEERGGLVIRLNRSEHLIDAKLMAGRNPNHVSETDLDDYDNFDFVYQNDGTIEDLKEAIKNFL